MVKPFTSNGDVTVTIIPNTNGDGVTEDAKTQVYSPNTASYSGVSIGYKDISFSYGSTNPTSESSKLEKGTTNYNDFQFHFFKKKFGLDLYYQTFEGMYRASAEASERESLGGVQAYPKLPSMAVKKYGANFYYVRTPKSYSIPAAFEQTHVQRSSGGSLIGMVSFNDVNISNKGEAILPADQQENFGVDSGFSGARLKSLGVGVGGGYTLVILKYFYLTGQLIIGRAYQRFKGNGIAKTGEQDLQASTQNFRFSGGLNMKQFFIGIMWINDKVSTETDTLTIEPESRYTSVFLGYRF